MYAHAHAHKHKMLNHVMIHIILKRTCDRLDGLWHNMLLLDTQSSLLF